jgi:hypothetical protein
LEDYHRMVDMKQQSREHKRDLYVDSSLAMQRIRHIEEEEEMNRISTGKMVKQRSLNRILKVIKNNGVAKQKLAISSY